MVFFRNNDCVFLFRGLYLYIKKNFQNTKNFDFSLILFGPIFGAIIDASRLFGFLFDM